MLTKKLKKIRKECRKAKDPILLTEYVRHRLARTICTRYRDKDSRLTVVTLDPSLEDRVRAGFDHNEHGMFIRMSPPAVEATCRLIASGVPLTVESRLSPGMRVRVTCSAPLPVTTDAATATAPGTASPAMAPTTTLAAASGQLGRCDSIVAIAPQETMNP